MHMDFVCPFLVCPCFHIFLDIFLCFLDCGLCYVWLVLWEDTKSEDQEDMSSVAWHFRRTPQTGNSMVFICSSLIGAACFSAYITSPFFFIKQLNVTDIICNSGPCS